MADNTRGTSLIDLGSFSDKAVKRLKKGRTGKLSDRVNDTLAALSERGDVPKDATAVIVVVKEKPKKSPLDMLTGGRVVW
jgi:hypothetical protein